jgi:hypothetical protein
MRLQPPLHCSSTARKPLETMLAAMSVWETGLEIWKLQCRELALIEGAVCAFWWPVCGAGRNDASWEITYGERRVVEDWAVRKRLAVRRDAWEEGELGYFAWRTVYRREEGSRRRRTRPNAWQALPSITPGFTQPRTGATIPAPNRARHRHQGQSIPRQSYMLSRMPSSRP